MSNKCPSMEQAAENLSKILCNNKIHKSKYWKAQDKIAGEVFGEGGEPMRCKYKMVVTKKHRTPSAQSQNFSALDLFRGEQRL